MYLRDALQPLTRSTRCEPNSPPAHRRSECRSLRLHGERFFKDAMMHTDRPTSMARALRLTKIPLRRTALRLGGMEAAFKEGGAHTCEIVQVAAASGANAYASAAAEHAAAGAVPEKNCRQVCDGLSDGRGPILSTVIDVLPKTTISRRRFLQVSALAAGGGLVAYSGLWDRHYLEIIEQTIRLRRLPEAFHGLRMAQVSDIHYDEYTEPFFVR